MDSSELAKYFCKLVFIVSLNLSLLLTAHAIEQAENSSTSTQQPLRIGIDPKLPPYTYLTDEGEASGFEVELTRAILDQQAIAYEFYPAIWSENFKKLKAGEIDLYPGVMRTDVRERDLDFSTIVTWFNVSLFVHYPSSVKRLSDLKNGVILVQRDTIWHTWITENAPHLSLVLVDTSEQVMLRLHAGEGDAALMMFEIGLYYQRKHKLNNIHSVGERVFEFESRIALPEDSELLRSKINDGIIYARENGIYDHIYGKWFGGLAPTSWISNPILKFLVGIAALLIGALALLTIWSRMLNRRVSEITSKYESGQDKLKFLQTVIDASHEMVWIKDTENNHVTLNKRAAESLGKTVEELQGTSAYEVFPEDADSYYQDDLIVIKTKKPKLGIIERLSGKDKILWISTDIYPIFDTDNIVTGVLVIVTDITEQKEVQKALEKTESEMKLAQTVIDTIRDMVWIKDTKNNHITVNKSAAESVGFTIEELKGTNMKEHFPDDAEGFYQDDLEVIKTKKPKLGIIERISAKGEKLWISTDKYPIFDDENTVTGVLVIVTDITEQKEVQNELEKTVTQMELAQTIIDTVHEMVWIKDTKNNHITLNKRAAESVGKTVEELQGRSAYDDFPDEAEAFYQDDLIVIKTKKPKLGIVERITTADEKLWISTDKYPIFDDANNVTGVLVIVTDITQQRKVQSTLKTREHVLTEYEQLANIGSWEHVFSTNSVHFSRGTSKIVDLSTEKSILPYDESFIVVHPEDRKRVFYEYNQSVKNKTKYNTYHRLRLRDGSIRYVNQICKTYYDDEGAPTRSIGIVQDVTALKELELKTLQTQTQLAHVERLNTLGQLSSSIAHEINQPLTSISQFCSSAKLRLNKTGTEDKDLLNYLDNAIHQSQRAGEIIRRLRSLVTRKLSPKSMQDINLLVTESVSLLQNKLQEKNIMLKLDLDNEMPTALVDAVQIQQVIINLIRNSIEALSAEAKDLREITIHTSFSEHGHISVSVQDNGPGVSDDKIDSLFEAYVSAGNDGLGLGLSICRSIIEAHDGKIWFEQEYTEGAKVNILL